MKTGMDFVLAQRHGLRRRFTTPRPASGLRPRPFSVLIPAGAGVEKVLRRNPSTLLEVGKKKERVRRGVALAIVLFTGSPCWAIDPFTVAAAAKTAGSIYSGDVSSLGALADSAESLGGLLLDLDIDSSNDEEGRRQLKELQDLSQKADDAKLVDADLRQTLKSGLERSASVSDKINQARKLIAIQRKISSLFGLRPKLAEHANSIQQTQVNYLILDELIALHQLEMRNHLDAESSLIARKAIVEKIRAEELGFRAKRRSLGAI